MRRMTGLDAAFVYAETPTMHMHVSMVAVFDPSTMPGGYSFDAVRRLVESRLPRIPMFRQRLVEVPFRLHHPVLIDDPDFDLDCHVRRVAVPGPGTLRELSDLAGQFVGLPLDRTRPLWEMWVVEGLEDGHFAVMAKVHHSMVDGVSGAEVLVHLMDLEPEAAPASDPAGAGEPGRAAGERVPSDLELVAHSLRSIAGHPARLARVVPATAASLARIVRRRRGGASGMAAPFSAPRVPFNAALSPHRSVAVTTLSLDEVKAVKNAFGATVNDVILSLCSGALRLYLADRGQLPDQPLIAVVPISVRAGSGEGAEGAEGANQVSAMFVSLASDRADPVERLRSISSGTRGAKEEHNALGAETLRNWAEFATPALFARAARFYSGSRLADHHRPIHNVIISNVPGPPFPLYLAGARLAVLAPLGPVMEGAGLNVTVISYMDRIDVGLIACRELVPDLWKMADCFTAAMEELRKAAGL